MSSQELSHKLLFDLSKIGLPVDEVEIYLRPYSKTYYGRYFPTDDKGVKPKLYLYPFANTKGEFMDYSELLDTAIHEMCHHKQHTDSSFVRVKGVMHDSQFWKMYNYYIDKAKNLLGVKIYDKTLEEVYG